MKPLMKLLVMRCRPKPMPTPSAPPNTASVVRSIPTASMATKKASAIRIDLLNLPKATCSDGVMCGMRRMRRSITPEIQKASVSNSAISATSLIVASSEMRELPTSTHPFSLQISQNIPLRNAPSLACARHQIQIHLILSGNAPHDGADAPCVAAFGWLWTAVHAFWFG